MSHALFEFYGACLSPSLYFVPPVPIPTPPRRSFTRFPDLGSMVPGTMPSLTVSSARLFEVVVQSLHCECVAGERLKVEPSPHCRNSPSTSSSTHFPLLPATGSLQRGPPRCHQVDRRAALTF